MSTTLLEPETREWSAAELRLLPLEVREEILARAAELALVDYRSDPELTAFDAFGEEDLYGNSANAEPG